MNLEKIELLAILCKISLNWADINKTCFDKLMLLFIYSLEPDDSDYFCKCKDGSKEDCFSRKRPKTSNFAFLYNFLVKLLNQVECENLFKARQKTFDGIIDKEIALTVNSLRSQGIDAITFLKAY